MILSPKAIIKLLWEQHVRPFCRQAFLLLTKHRPLTGHDTVDSSGIVGMPPGMSRLFLPVATRYPSGDSLETISPTPPHPGKSHTDSAAM